MQGNSINTHKIKNLLSGQKSFFDTHKKYHKTNKSKCKLFLVLHPKMLHVYMDKLKTIMFINDNNKTNHMRCIGYIYGSDTKVFVDDLRNDCWKEILVGYSQRVSDEQKVMYWPYIVQ